MAMALPIAYIFLPVAIAHSRLNMTLTMVCLGVRRVQAAELGAEEAGVHRDRLHAPAGRTAARLLGEVVGVVGHPLEPHWRARLEEVHDLGAAVDVGVAPNLRHDLPDDRVEVCLRGVVVARVNLAGRLKGVVSGDPDAAAGASRRAAKVRALLDEQGAQAVPTTGRQRSRHARATSANDHNIELWFHEVVLAQ
jgi:hypothetical protein